MDITDLAATGHALSAGIFAVLALLSMFTFRKQLYEKIRGEARGFRETLAGNSVTVKETLEPGKETRLQFRGSDWTAVNVGDKAIETGSRATIVSVDGLTLHIAGE